MGPLERAVCDGSRIFDSWLQGVPRIRTDDAVRNQMMLPLKLADGRFGARPERVRTDYAEKLLQAGNMRAGGTAAERGTILVIDARNQCRRRCGPVENRRHTAAEDLHLEGWIVFAVRGVLS